MKFCPNCGNAVFNTDRECKICAFEIPEFFSEFYDSTECKQLDTDSEFKTATCPSCGSAHAMDFCPDCGYNLKRAEKNQGWFYNDCAYLFEDVIKVVDSNVTEFVFPKGIVKISESAFANCDKLEIIDVPDGVVTIENYAFANCSELKTATIPDSVTYIGDIFSGSDNIEYTEYENARYIGNTSNPYHALIEYTNKDATRAELHPDTKVIASYAFRSCKKLTEIELPDALKSICTDAFIDCKQLMSITIPKSVEGIEHNAFPFCYKLLIYCESDAIDWVDDKWNSDCPVIWDCDNNDKCSNALFVEIDGVRYKLINSKATVVAAHANIIKAIIPEYIEHAGNKYKVTEIKHHAFSACRELKTLAIPATVEDISYWAFSDCDSLKTLHIPDSVKYIGDYAFFDCDSLKRVILPKNIKIGHDAFYNSYGKRFYYKGTEEEYKTESDKTDAGIYERQVYYYSETEPTTDGKFWHYGKNGAAVEWD